MSNISSAIKAIKNKPKEIDIGVQIKIIKDEHMGNHLIKTGMKAKIIQIEKPNPCILLEFKENIKGHDGEDSKIKGKNNHCWWVNKNEIKII